MVSNFNLHFSEYNEEHIFVNCGYLVFLFYSYFCPFLKIRGFVLLLINVNSCVS